MTDKTQTTENTCQEYAAYRYTWPGRDEAFICSRHQQKAAALAGSMGMHLQFIPLEPCTEEDHPKCHQIVK